MEIKTADKKQTYTFPQPHSSSNVPDGGSATILNFNIPEATIGKIDSIGNNYFDDTYFRVYVDGILLESNNIVRQIGAINLPYKYAEPLIAKASIKVVAYNDDTEDHIMECVINGILEQLKDCE